MTEIQLRKGQVTYQPRGWLGEKLCKWGISMKKMFNKEPVDLYVRIKSGNNLSEPIKDLIYKQHDGNFKTYKTKVVINDELDNKFIAQSTTGRPFMNGIYNNGTGDLKFYRIGKMRFETSDVRANDVMEKVATKMLAMLDAGKFQKMLVAMFIAGMISLGIFNLLSYIGLGQVVQTGIETMVEKAASAIGSAVPSAP
jgi:hypothetical protein